MCVHPFFFAGNQVVGGPTIPSPERSLDSTSNSPNTALRSTSDIPSVSDGYIVAGWFMRTGTGNNDTIWCNEDGSDQIYTNPSHQLQFRYGNSGTSGGTVAFTLELNTWYFIWVRFGLNISGSDDAIAQVIEQDGTVHTASTNTATVASSTTTTAQLHYVLGDDPSTGVSSDDGYLGRWFALGFYDSASLTADDLGCNSSGKQKDISASAFSASVYLLFGKNASDAGEDASGNGNNFTNESTAITLSTSDLPVAA